MVLRRTFEALLRRFAGQSRAAVWRTLDDPGALWAVGDVHGCTDLYRKLEERILNETDLPATVVLLGDMIDRGPDSRGMLELLLAEPPAGLRRVALMGNHEDMALRFLSNPEGSRGWLGYGGRETLLSYGVAVDDATPPAALRDLWRRALPAVHLTYLTGLPHAIGAGRHILTHAGADAEVPLARQGRTALVWHRHAEIGDLIPPADLGDRIVVHGHVPVAEARLNGWRLNLDTHAFRTGRLTAACLFPDAPPQVVTIVA